MRFLCSQFYSVIQSLWIVCLFILTHSIKLDVCHKQNYLQFYLEQHLNISPRHHDEQNKKERHLISSLRDWKFASKQILYETFPIDPVKENYIRQVNNVLFSVVYPIPFKTKTRLISVSEDSLVNILDMDPNIVLTQQFVDFASGAYLHPGAIPLSHRYGGHQFGSWADQLGDGRAVMLGEYVNRAGERWELQLKGSGLTPYSRRGDGRAVLRSSVREYLCSEAMYFLGIPTSRAASLVVSSDPVLRDQFYDGHARNERGAVVLRLAKSWFRIGSLELLANRGEIDLLKQLVDFVIKSYFPSIVVDDNRYLAFYSEVVTATAVMIAKWQSVGFAHGVCNTDNFSLLSITIDYGPFGFLDEYDPSFIPNTSDDEAMYSYEKQPDVGAFNLNKLRISLLPLLNEKDKKHAMRIYNGYADVYKSEFMNIFRKKLGLINSESDDEQLVAVLLKMMEDDKADFTMTFRQLGELSISDLETGRIGHKHWTLHDLKDHEWFNRWLPMYIDRVKSTNITQSERRSLMNSVNPRYVLRNWIAQKAISLAEDDNFEEVRKVARVLQNPFKEQTEAEVSGYADRPPLWSKSLKVSCSS